MAPDIDIISTSLGSLNFLSESITYLKRWELQLGTFSVFGFLNNIVDNPWLSSAIFPNLKVIVGNLVVRDRQYLQLQLLSLQTIKKDMLISNIQSLKVPLLNSTDLIVISHSSLEVLWLPLLTFVNGDISILYNPHLLELNSFLSLSTVNGSIYWIGVLTTLLFLLLNM